MMGSLQVNRPRSLFSKRTSLFVLGSLALWLTACGQPASFLTRADDVQHTNDAEVANPGSAGILPKTSDTGTDGPTDGSTAGSPEMTAAVVAEAQAASTTIATDGDLLEVLTQQVATAQPAAGSDPTDGDLPGTDATSPATPPPASTPSMPPPSQPSQPPPSQPPPSQPPPSQQPMPVPPPASSPTAGTLPAGLCWCAGGPIQPSYMLSSAAEAQACAMIEHSDPRAGCAADARFGLCACGGKAPGWQIDPRLHRCQCIQNAQINSLPRSVRWSGKPSRP